MSVSGALIFLGFCLHERNCLQHRCIGTVSGPRARMFYRNSKKWKGPDNLDACRSSCNLNQNSEADVCMRSSPIDGTAYFG